MSEIVDKLVCPRCGSEKFLEGPHGGEAINIKCSECGYWMNMTPLPDGRFWILEKEELKVAEK